ncbi:MAG: hypothetical protein HUJ90_06170 [Bacteroidales bacterium]|nr:hypothetical protein [Bacteroidales bacterium]
MQKLPLLLRPLQKLLLKKPLPLKLLKVLLRLKVQLPNQMRILKSYGTDGGLLVSSAMAPSDFPKNEPVFITFDEIPVPFFVENWHLFGSNRIYIKLEDIDSLESAEELVGKDIVTKAEADAEDDVVGFKVINADTKEIVGTVSSFIDIPGNPCLEVGDKIIPCHEDLIKKVDLRKKEIIIKIPEGLI